MILQRLVLLVMLQTLRGSTDFVGNRRVLEERPSEGSQDMAVDAAAAPAAPPAAPVAGQSQTQAGAESDGSGSGDDSESA